MGIETERDLLSHNKLGDSWEGYALECAVRSIGMRNQELAFWATHAGAEVDLFWQAHGRNWAIECKYSSGPKLTPSMTSAIQDLGLAHLWVVYPGERVYPLAPRASAVPIASLPTCWQYPQPAGDS